VRYRPGKILIGILFGSWVLLAFHTHKPHLRDLHPGHEPCLVCVQSSRIFQNVLPASASGALWVPGINGIISCRRETLLSFQPSSLRNARAPPEFPASL